MSVRDFNLMFARDDLVKKNSRFPMGNPANAKRVRRVKYRTRWGVDQRIIETGARMHTMGVHLIPYDGDS